MPKKLKSNQNLKIETFFGNMQKDSKMQKNVKKSEDTPNIKVSNTKSVNQKHNIPIQKEEKKNSPKNKKTKIKISEKEKIEEEEKEKRKNEKPIKITTLKKDNEKEKITQIKNNNYISDSESSKGLINDLNLEDINFSDYKMDIEEDDKEITAKSKSKNENLKKKGKTYDEDFNMDDIDLKKVENIINAEQEEKTIANKKSKNRVKNVKGKERENTNKNSSIKRNKDIKTSTNAKGRSKQNMSNNSNIIEGPLSNETIVITGEFTINRDELTNLLKSLGARVTGSVSSRTTILLHGDILEDGRPYNEGRKYRQAIEKKIKTLDLISFEKYVQAKTKNPNWKIDNKNNIKEDEDIELEEILNESIIIEDKKNEENNIKDDNKNKNENSNNNNNINNNIQIQGELWTTKYQPKKISDLIGNKTNINKLIEWLDDWNNVVLEGKTKKVEAKFHRGQKPTFENINARACLITGDPGIGKTSSVRLIAKLKGYKTYETNASDQRNKNSINKNAGFMLDNKTLFGGKLQEKNLIIMDEVDGMSGNEDRGGIAAIIDIIKKTKTPIICIANDRQSPKLKTLANYCYDLKFVHPDKRMISLRLSEICKKENIQYELNALEYLCEICGNDIRQIINYIELWTRTHKNIKFNDLNGKDQKIQGKDEIVMLTNFDAAKELLNSKSRFLPYRYLLDLYFIDYDLIPLLIQENYLFTFSSKNYINKREELENISLAADLISESDIIDKKIRINMDWRLLADRGLLGCCTICKLNKGFVPFPKFPEALGKISSLNKINRETYELKECFKCASGDEIRRQILPVFYSYLINNILDGNIEGILDIMKKYHITMEMFKENMTDLVGEKLKLAFEKVGTINKSNLTKAYNKNFKTSIIKTKNKKGKNQTNVNIGNEKVFDENGNPLNEKEEENGEEIDESSESVVKFNTQKAKIKNKEKGKKNKSSRSRSKSQEETKVNKKGKAKVKNKKTQKKKNESESDGSEHSID